MATTGFWPVKGSLKAVIQYADNPDKTTNRKYLDRDLADAIQYVENDAKTDEKLFVSAINCDPETAYEDMTATKVRFGKHGGNAGSCGKQDRTGGEQGRLSRYQGQRHRQPFQHPVLYRVPRHEGQRGAGTDHG